MTSKGQVTVPKPLREQAGLLPGSEVAFALDGERNVVLSAAKRSKRSSPSRGDRVVEAFRGSRTANKELSTDEIMRLIRGDA